MNVVLAHGIFGFRERVGILYFNGVQAFLEKTFQDTPIKIFVTQVAPAGRVVLRGQQLGDQIRAALNPDAGPLDPNAQTHIIAHSMGGLDARYCLSPGNANNIAAQAKVVSLSTIATPHHGSPVADVLTDDNSLDLFHLKIPFPSKSRDEFMAQLGLSLDGIQDLTSGTAEEFNDNYQDNPNVRYFSYAGKGRDGLKPTNTLFLPTHELIKLKTQQPNDGMVALDSATWGEGLIEVWAADHFDEIGHNLDGGLFAMPQFFDHLQAYQRIVERLIAL